MQVYERCMLWERMYVHDIKNKIYWRWKEKSINEETNVQCWEFETEKWFDNDLLQTSKVESVEKEEVESESEYMFNSIRRKEVKRKNVEDDENNQDEWNNTRWRKWNYWKFNKIKLIKHI